MTKVAVGRNIFDLTQRGLANRRGVYADDVQIERTPRYITHFQLRVVDPDTVASFYRDVEMSIERPAPEHLGFRVESLGQFEADLQKMVDADPALAPQPTTGAPEREARLELLRTCVYGQRHLADPDGVLIDISEG